MGDALDTVYEITKLIKKSPKRDVLFQKVKDDVTPGSPGVRILCPTRWTVRAEALSSIAENYQALQMTWDAAKEATRDSEMRARIGGVAAQMEKFDFFCGVELGRKILNMADNLSRSLQEKCIGMLLRRLRPCHALPHPLDTIWPSLTSVVGRLNASITGFVFTSCQIPAYSAVSRYVGVCMLKTAQCTFISHPLPPVAHQHFLCQFILSVLSAVHTCTAHTDDCTTSLGLCKLAAAIGTFQFL